MGASVAVVWWLWRSEVNVSSLRDLPCVSGVLQVGRGVRGLEIMLGSCVATKAPKAFVYRFSGLDVVVGLF